MGAKEMLYIQEAFEKNWLTTAGENIQLFETGLCNATGAAYCAALNSGTAALHLALRLAGVEKDDEVLCATFTFVASVNPILYLGATPILIDSEPDTWNMSPELLEKAILERIRKGKKPKAIVVVHLYGRPALLTELCSIAERYEIPLIEDAAESLGSRYKNRMTGTFGTAGILSFNGNKIITTSGGGALLTADETTYKKVIFLASQARENAVHYQHHEMGYNYRMSNVLAGIGRGQLEVLDERIARKRAIFDFYKKNLSEQAGFIFPEDPAHTFCNRWLTTLVLPDNDTRTPEQLRLSLEKDNIESRPLWKPMHLQPLFDKAPAYLNGTSEKLFEKGLCLPSGTSMTEEEIQRVIAALLSQ
jgi:dTDP-4-amino-4,6-dideoxygalactose transaminase